MALHLCLMLQQFHTALCQWPLCVNEPLLPHESCRWGQVWLPVTLLTERISLSPLMGKWMSADQLETPPPSKQRWKAPHFPSCAPTDDFSLLLLDPPECSPALLSTGPEVPTCRWTSNLTPPGGPCKPPPHSPAFPVGLSKTKENLNKFIWHRIVFTSHRVKNKHSTVCSSLDKEILFPFSSTEPDS